MGDVAWGDLAYRVYTTALASLVLVVFASGLVGDERLSPDQVDQVRRQGPAWAGLLVALALVVGVRSGRRSGPLALEAADVHHLLLAPLDRSSVLRVPALSTIAYAAAGTVALGGLAGELLSQRLPGGGTSWLLSGALFGLAVAAAGLGAAMLTASRRLPAPVAPLVLTALLVWSVLDLADVAPTAPLTVLGRMPLWPLGFEPWSLVGLAAALGIAAVGVHWVGGLSIEAARRRTQLVGQLRFAVTQQDIRSVLLLRRQLAAERPRSRPRVRRLPGWLGRSAPVFTRDLQSLARWPTVRILRVLGLVTAAALALRATYGGTTPLILVAGALTYVAALDAVEPLAQEVDHPTLLRSYPRPLGVVLVHHLAAPVVVMLVAGALGLATAFAVGPAIEVLTLGAITAVSGALAAVSGAAISVVSEVVLDQSGAAMLSPEVAGPRVVIRTLWPPAVAVIGLTPVLLAQRAMRAGEAVTAPALIAAVAALMLVAVVFTWVRYRADLHAAMAEAMGGSRT
jgi:hypothetical protein